MVCRTATRLLYLREGCTLQGTATLLSCQAMGANRASIILDRTHFYPQGGGQPTDIGTIADIYKVENVHLDTETDQVHHECTCDEASPAPSVNSQVSYKIDEPTRSLHCRLHSAGHLLDVVIFDVMGLGASLKVGKAYHYPQGPSIEYIGDASTFVPTGNPVAKQALMKQIEQHCNELVQKDYPVLISFDPNEEYLTDGVTINDKATRWIQFGGGGFGRKIACGGTHVSHLREIGKMIIRKIEYKASSKTLRIGYDVV